MAQEVSVIVGDDDRARLEVIVKDRNQRRKHVQRAQIVLLSADRLPVAQVARRASVSRPAVWRWQRRFAKQGVSGLLRDKTRPPGTPPLPDETVTRVVAMTCAEPPGEATHWTGRAMAKQAGISLSSVQRIWAEHDLQPHRLRTFKRSNDPAFAGCSSVTIDTGPAFQAACGITEENDNMQALRFALTLRSFTQLPGNPVVLVPTHPVKNAGKDNLLPRGGSAFLNEMDGNLTPWAEGDRTTTELSWAGKLRGPSFGSIAFALDTGKCDALVDAKRRHIPQRLGLPDHRRTSRTRSLQESRGRGRDADHAAKRARLQHRRLGQVARVDPVQWRARQVPRP